MSTPSSRWRVELNGQPIMRAVDAIDHLGEPVPGLAKRQSRHSREDRTYFSPSGVSDQFGWLEDELDHDLERIVLGDELLHPRLVHPYPDGGGFLAVADDLGQREGTGDDE